MLSSDLSSPEKGIIVYLLLRPLFSCWNRILQLLQFPQHLPGESLWFQCVLLLNMFLRNFFVLTFDMFQSKQRKPLRSREVTIVKLWKVSESYKSMSDGKYEMLNYYYYSNTHQLDGKTLWGIKQNSGIRRKVIKLVSQRLPFVFIV